MNKLAVVGILSLLIATIGAIIEYAETQRTGMKLGYNECQMVGSSGTIWQKECK